MDFFGIGGVELIFVLVVATLVLGPAKMVELATSIGRFWREAQKVLRETADAATIKLDAPLVPEQDVENQLPLDGPETSVASDNGSNDSGPASVSVDEPEEAQSRG